MMRKERMERLSGLPGHLRRLALAAAALCGVAFFAAPAPASEPLRVVATIAQIGQPLAEIVDGRAEVVSMMGEGVDPHLYRPTRSDIVRLSRADVVFYVGLNLEAQLADTMDKLSARSTVVALGERLPRARLLAVGGDDYPDPHVWMDPDLWREALTAAVETLAARDPDNAAHYRARAADYLARLEELDAYMHRAAESVPPGARALVTAHDAFGYFGRAYGFEVHGIQGISTESEAGLRRIEELVDLLVEQKIGAVFVESSVSDRSVRALIDGAAARGHRVAVGGELYSDAMGAPGTYEGTYIGMLDHNVTVIARALGGSVPADGLHGRLKLASN